MKRIYADAAAATPLSRRSRDELVRLLDAYGNAGALHQEGVKAKEELENARASIARAIGAHADEIIFTASGTEGNNLAIQGALRPLLLEHAELHAITCAIEHQSVLEPLRALEREGLYVTVLPVDAEGRVSAKEVREAVNEETVFVSIQLVNSEIGMIEPVREIAKEIRKIRTLRQARGDLPLYFHTDASQAPLWMKVGVPQLGIDLMTLDGQKVLGPKGVGCLYVRRGTKLEPVMWGGAQEAGLRGGTPNTPLCGAFAVAFEDAQKDIEERVQKVAAVRDYCWGEIKKLLPEAILNGPAINKGRSFLSDKKDRPFHRVANNLNISIPKLDAQMAVVALDAAGIAASTRSACDIGDEEPSHVIQAITVGVADPERSRRTGTAIRITFLPDITRAQARVLAEALADVAARYRQP